MALRDNCIGLLVASDENGVVRDFLNVIISELVLFFNVGKTMTDIQVKATVDLILSDPRAASMSFPDMKICFENAKKGHYGKQYDRVDGQIIFEWINAYFDEKSTLIEEANNLSHDKAKKSQPADAVPESLTKEDWMNGSFQKPEEKDETGKPKERITPQQWVELQNNLKEIAKKSNVRTEKKPSEKTDQEKLIQRFMRQFDRIYLTKGVENPGGKFIHMYGVVGKHEKIPYVSIIEYVEHKLKQNAYIRSDKSINKRFPNINQPKK